MTTTTTLTPAQRVAAVLRAADLVPALYTTAVYDGDLEAVAVFAMPEADGGHWGPALRASVAQLLADEFGADNVSHGRAAGRYAVIVENA